MALMLAILLLALRQPRPVPHVPDPRWFEPRRPRKPVARRMRRRFRHPDQEAHPR